MKTSRQLKDWGQSSKEYDLFSPRGGDEPYFFAYIINLKWMWNWKAVKIQWLLAGRWVING